MRMVALGQLLHDEGNVVHFATLRADDDTRLRLETEGFSVHALPGDLVAGSPGDASALRNVAAGLRADWLVLDGYAFETDYQRAVKGVAANLLSVDDLAKCHFVGDVVLNQNYGADRLAYSKEPYTRLVLGPSHILLRPEFRAIDPSRLVGAARRTNLLVTLGGGTTASLRALHIIVAALASVKTDLLLRVASGIRNELPNDLIRACERDARIQLLGHIDDMQVEMSVAAAAICSGGSTIWELMYMQVPFAAIALTEPQVGFLDMLRDDGLCTTLGLYNEVEPAHAAKTIQALLDSAELRRGCATAADGLIQPAESKRKLLKVFAI